jgi:hypothetical protein
VLSCISKPYHHNHQSLQEWLLGISISKYHTAPEYQLNESRLMNPVRSPVKHTSYDSTLVVEVRKADFRMDGHQQQSTPRSSAPMPSTMLPASAGPDQGRTYGISTSEYRPGLHAFCLSEQQHGQHQLPTPPNNSTPTTSPVRAHAYLHLDLDYNNSPMGQQAYCIQPNQLLSNTPWPNQPQSTTLSDCPDPRQ